MIVLGPNVISRPNPDNCIEAEPLCYDNEDQVDVNSQLDQFDDCEENNGDAEWTKRWEEARLEVSRMLGSIGAAPLASPVCANCNPTLMSSSTNNINIDTEYFDITTQLAATHVDLIQSMYNAVKVIQNSTSIRLGLGAIHSGSERVVSRAEKAWTERQQKQNGRLLQDFPKLTVSKSRQILHHTMLDQATSLREILSCDDVHCEEYDEFIEDMRYCFQQNSILTLSKLSVWLSVLRDLLSFVVSELLCKSYTMRDKGVALKQSTQLAKERGEFLQSAFDLSSATNDGCSENAKTKQKQKSPENEGTQNALKTIHLLQSTLEAAQVSLWAMKQSFLDKHNEPTYSDKETPREWLSQMKELIVQTKTSLDHFESAFLPAPLAEEDAKLDGEKSGISSTQNNHSHEFEVHNESIDVPVTCTILNSNHPPQNTEHADKTWVFSASGQQPFTRSRRNRDTGTAQRSTAMFEQSMLMRDLQKRLGTMQLAQEHDAVKLDAQKEDELDLKPRRQQSVPFFLGVQGSVLSELASALRSGGGDS